MVVGLIATVSSCTQRSLNALNPCTINGVVQNVPVNPQRALDLLIIIDDSPSMLDEQAKLAEQVPRLVSLLLTGGEADPGAVGTFPAIESLHVGIITPDLGHSTEPPHNFTAGSGPDVDFNPTGQCMTNNGNGKAGFMQVEGLLGVTSRSVHGDHATGGHALPELLPRVAVHPSGLDQRRRVRDRTGRRLRLRAAAREHPGFGSQHGQWRFQPRRRIARGHSDHRRGRLLDHRPACLRCRAA